MKRSNQLLLESAIVASLILGLILGGTIAGLNLPSAWTNLPNPSEVQNQYNYTSIALLYNTTFTLLSERNFSSASLSLNSFSFLNYPVQLDPVITSGNSEISALNSSLPPAISYLGLARNLTTGGQVVKANQNLAQGCTKAQVAEANYLQFRGTTTTDLESNGVPVSVYSSSLDLVGSQIVTLLDLCTNISSQLKGLSNPTISDFTIASPQTSLETGGYVQIQGNLKVDSEGIVNDSILLFLNGTKFASTQTDKNGFFSINSSTPFVYENTAAIWAVASGVSSGFPGAVSNTLYLELTFNQTQIYVADPPEVFPTFNFTVSGKLTTSSGVALPEAPIKITSFNVPYFVTTNASGFFSTSLRVPRDATEGIQTIYVSFAPQGVFGPSINFTTIDVIREIPQITINPISIAYSGVEKTITGNVVANGTRLPLANITLNSPWGKFQTQTNALGEFSIHLPIPISAFSYSNDIKVSTHPSQPFIKEATVATSMNLLNPLEFVLPLLVGGVLVYELRNLGILQRKHADHEEREEKEVDQTVKNLLSQSVAEKTLPRLVSVYRSSLVLAAKKFGLKFPPSSTIREIVSQVSLSAQSSGMKEFDKISITFEEYLYAKSFDENQISIAEDALARLQELWR